MQRLVQRSTLNAVQERFIVRCFPLFLHVDRNRKHPGNVGLPATCLATYPGTHVLAYHAKEQMDDVFFYQYFFRFYIVIIVSNPSCRNVFNGTVTII